MEAGQALDFIPTSFPTKRQEWVPQVVPSPRSTLTGGLQGKGSNLRMPCQWAFSNAILPLHYFIS